jgi:hypothetical protein
MKYIFTDEDGRNYQREKKREIIIQAEKMEKEIIKIKFVSSEKDFLSIILTKKEATGMVSAIIASNSGCECKVSI